MIKFSDQTKPMWLAKALIFSFFIVYSKNTLASSQDQPKLKFVPYSAGFDEPNGIYHAGDERLFITERHGKIMLILPGGQVQEEPFLDIRLKVGSEEDINQGLLGLAFHPLYSTNGYFYVNYTNINGNTVISRFQVSASDPNVADPASEKILLTVEQPAPQHNGGTIAFGADGYLYIGLGDGEYPGDPNENAQNLSSLLGKILRIDVNGNELYQIPPDNPFANDGNPATQDEIWAYGLRNPWRFSFDRLTGDLWIGDVGQDNWEEINFQEAANSGGENYGWDCYEGNHIFEIKGCSDNTNFTFPIYEYDHQGSCAVIGGYVYRGPQTFIQGNYFFTDLCSGKILSLVKNTSGEWDLYDWATIDRFIFTFGEDASGNLYIGADDGIIYQLRFEQLLYLPLIIQP